MNADRRIAEISSLQGGALRLDQALDVGLTKGQIDYRLRSARWTRLARGAYLITPMVSVEDHLRAAVVSLPGAVVAHEAAAELHSLSYVKRGLATVLVHSQTTHEFPGVIVRRCHDLVDEHVMRIDDLPVTTPPRTVVDLAAIVTERHLGAVLDDAISARITTYDEVAAVVDLVGRSGKPGTTSMRSVLHARTGPLRNATVLERKGYALLLQASQLVPEVEYPIPWKVHKRFDAAYPVARLAIEWDSRRHHSQAEAMQRDRARDRDAILHGWRILRFTWDDVVNRPETVVATVREALQPLTA